MSFDVLPYKPSVKVNDFHAEAKQSILDELHRRLADTPPLPETYETSSDEYGVSKEWMERAIAAWKVFDWRKQEERVNSFNNYTAELELNGYTHNIHFVGLFSKNVKATPILFVHGWPGKF
jgi:microsomal epoxide hydrolase